MEIKHRFLWIYLVIILKKRVICSGHCFTKCLSYRTKEIIHRFSYASTGRDVFPCPSDEMLVVLDLLFKTLLMVFHVFLRSPSQEAILLVKYSRLSPPFSLLT